MQSTSMFMGMVLMVALVSFFYVVPNREPPPELGMLLLACGAVIGYGFWRVIELFQLRDTARWLRKALRRYAAEQ